MLYECVWILCIVCVLYLVCEMGWIYYVKGVEW